MIKLRIPTTKDELKWELQLIVEKLTTRSRLAHLSREISYNAVRLNKRELKRRLQVILEYTKTYAPDQQIGAAHFSGWVSFGANKDPKQRFDWIRIYQPSDIYLGMKKCDHFPGVMRKVYKGPSHYDRWLDIYGVKYPYTMLLKDMQADLQRRIDVLG